MPRKDKGAKAVISMNNQNIVACMCWQIKCFVPCLKPHMHTNTNRVINLSTRGESPDFRRKLRRQSS